MWILRVLWILAFARMTLFILCHARPDRASMGNVRLPLCGRLSAGSPVKRGMTGGFYMFMDPRFRKDDILIYVFMDPRLRKDDRGRKMRKDDILILCVYAHPIGDNGGDAGEAVQIIYPGFASIVPFSTPVLSTLFSNFHPFENRRVFLRLINSTLLI